MESLRRISQLPLHEDPIDAWLSKWGSSAGGLLLLVLTVAVLPSHASGRAQLLLGVGMAAIACLNLVLFGVMSRQVHLACHRGDAAWRVRLGEFLGLGVGIAIISAGLWVLATLRLEPAGMIVGGLLVFAMAIATMCLGLWSTLSRAALRFDGLQSHEGAFPTGTK